MIVISEIIGQLIEAMKLGCQLSCEPEGKIANKSEIFPSSQNWAHT